MNWRICNESQLFYVVVCGEKRLEADIMNPQELFHSWILPFHRTVGSGVMPF